MRFGPRIPDIARRTPHFALPSSMHLALRTSH